MYVRYYEWQRIGRIEIDLELYLDQGTDKLTPCRLQTDRQVRLTSDNADTRPIPDRKKDYSTRDGKESVGLSVCNRSHRFDSGIQLTAKPSQKPT